MIFLDVEELLSHFRSIVTYQDLALGDYLFYQNDPAHSIFALQSGTIRLLHYTNEGQEIDHYRVHAGEIFAEIALFKESYVCTAIVEEPARVARFPKSEFWPALQQDPALSSAFMELLAHRLHQTKIMLEIRGIRSTRERILHYLRYMADSGKEIMQFHRSMRVIAQDLGVSPESLSRTLKQLQKEGIITRTKRMIQLNK
ncbi:Crp/Fnr family transcriptional regulator [Leptolyngbya boryana CZ1]|uniref:Crp/Fnr family transcriptional regulator n=1 Tax=Leptolyngbya boryana CZ1 TaxID=3060204 RepID=A0AA97AME9_LEPBY|nr:MULTISPECIES: Crp/Fnr family transcriptional regulator [Leptolyngbya]MBD1859339.1 Crp/Fnr family transcriptional regulator [Leptolyngbya sp. FACHB-1624]WNZ43239.1 Crp/Fnr family transcriptional regulator [Leptolyngbya boryana CZ1]